MLKMGETVSPHLSYKFRLTRSATKAKSAWLILPSDTLLRGCSRLYFWPAAACCFRYIFFSPSSLELAGMDRMITHKRRVDLFRISLIWLFGDSVSIFLSAVYIRCSMLAHNSFGFVAGLVHFRPPTPSFIRLSWHFHSWWRLYIGPFYIQILGSRWYSMHGPT